jgi:4a-hydroxytetrahydrobiopterin dehydratase
LTHAEVRAALLSLPGWSVQAGRLHCEYAFVDFVDADAFLRLVRKSIPNWNLHARAVQNFQRIIVDLQSVEAGAITVEDVQVASALETWRRQYA